MLKWLSLWWENRFPPKPLPMVGLIGLLTEDQLAQYVRNSESKEGD